MSDRKYAHHPLELLEQLAQEGDEIAHACMSMYRRGDDEGLVISTALREYALSRRHLLETTAKAVERFGMPMTIRIEKP